MIRIRFHGRGGHGVKTASRIIGSAAFLEGFECQDSPVYGAERRGAAVTAYNRISKSRILERGTIGSPDLIVVADETLLADPLAGVLSGQDLASAIFINCASAEPLVDKYAIHPSVYSHDVTECTLRILGRASAMSAGLAAAASRLIGTISAGALDDAMRREFAELHVTPADIEKNLEIAREVFAALPVAPLKSATAARLSTVVSIPYEGPFRATPSVVDPGNSMHVQTGAWRIERPVIDPSICTRCGLCFVQCPDGAISIDSEGYPVIDYDHCKGCMICREVCPLEAIGREKETRAW
jgi:pyruvate ferredoxin oxidoreductase gamma subunit